MARKKTEVDKLRQLHRKQYESNRKKILASQEVCAICGGLVDKKLPKGNPWSAEIDHIRPISRGGSSDIENLQLTHRRCNREKWDSFAREEKATNNKEKAEVITNRDLPWSVDWLKFNEK